MINQIKDILKELVKWLLIFVIVCIAGLAISYFLGIAMANNEEKPKTEINS